MPKDTPIALLISASDFNNDSRLQRLHKQISMSGFQVETIAYGAPSSEKGKHLSTIPVRSFAARLFDVAKMVLSRFLTDEQLLKLLSKRLITRDLTNNCITQLAGKSANLIVVKHWTSLPTALLQKGNAKIWLDINEVFHAEHDNSKLWQIIYRPVILRLLTISKDQISLQSATSLDQIKCMNDENILHLPNTKEPLSNISRSQGEDNVIRLLYHGLITTNRSLPTLINALKQSGRKDMHLTIRGHGKPRYIASLKALAVKLAISDQVKFEPSVANCDLIKIASQYDIGFCLFANRSKQLTLAEPNKIYEYMAAGLAIIASETPTMRRMIKDANIGKLSDISQTQAQSIAQILQDLKRDQIIEWQDNSYQQAIYYWNQNHDWPKLEKFLKTTQLDAKP